MYTRDDIINIIDSIEIDEKTFSFNEVCILKNVGDKLYEYKVRKSWDNLGLEKIIDDIGNEFPEIKKLDMENVINKYAESKYLKNALIYKLEDIYQGTEKRDKIYTYINQYWEKFKKFEKDIDQEYEELTSLLGDKFIVLEKYPNVVKCFDILEKIENDVLNNFTQKVNILKNKSNKTEIFKMIDEEWDSIYKDTCHQYEIFDENIIHNLTQMGKSKKEMLKLNISLGFLAKSFF